jgi:hypothetical protein
MTAAIDDRLYEKAVRQEGKMESIEDIIKALDAADPQAAPALRIHHDFSWDLWDLDSDQLVSGGNNVLADKDLIPRTWLNFLKLHEIWVSSTKALNNFLSLEEFSNGQNGQ